MILPTLSASPLRLKLIDALRGATPGVFTRRVVYDGKQNLFAPYELALGDSNSAEVCPNYSPTHVMDSVLIECDSSM